MKTIWLATLAVAGGLCVGNADAKPSLTADTPTADRLQNLDASGGTAASVTYDAASPNLAIGGDVDASTGTKKVAPSTKLTKKSKEKTPPSPAKDEKDAKKKAPGDPFLDSTTVGLAALGTMAGAAMGIALVASCGVFGPILGAFLGAAALVGIWKAFGKTTKSDKDS